MSNSDFPALMSAIERDHGSHGAKVAIETLSMLVSARLCMAFNGNDRACITRCLKNVRARLVFPENISFIDKVLATTWPDARIIARYRDMQVADRKTLRVMKKGGL